jgi:hypothetical protein
VLFRSKDFSDRVYWNSAITWSDHQMDNEVSAYLLQWCQEEE